MAALPKPQVPQSPMETVINMQARMECQSALASLVQRTPSVVFASIATVDGRSYAHVNSPAHETSAPRAAAIMSSLMGLIESFSREALNSRTLYNSSATEHGSIVIVRVPSREQKHTLCLCADATDNLAMTIRAALDTAALLAEKIDADG